MPLQRRFSFILLPFNKMHIFFCINELIFSSAIDEFSSSFLPAVTLASSSVHPGVSAFSCVIRIF